MLGILIAVAFAGALAGTSIARGTAWAFGLVDRPNPIVPQHRRAVPHLGGFGIAVGFAAALAASALIGVPLLAFPAYAMQGFLVGAAGYLGAGTYDDARPLKPLAKLIVQTTIAIGAVAFGGADAPIEVALAAGGLVAVINAVNLTDVCDGLVGSLAAVALIVIALVSPAAAPIALVLAAACVGFLCFNWAPASIFLGDGGSHLLGFSVGYLWFSIIVDTPSWHLTVAAGLGIAVFVLELLFLVIVRHRRGIPFWRGSPDHLALRLQAAGMSTVRTVQIELVVAALFGAVAFWLASQESVVALGVGIVLAAIAACAVALLYTLEPVPRAGRSREEQPA